MRREWLLHRMPTTFARRSVCFGGGAFGGDLVLARVGFKLAEFELHLVDETAQALRLLAVRLALQPRDLQLQAFDDDARRRQLIPIPAEADSFWIPKFVEH
jgi:hypothetical protein